MIHDQWLRWLVTGLSMLSAAEWANVIATRRRAWRFIVSYTLHLVMAIAMAVMAWPFSAHLPTTGPAVFFLFAAAWFVTVTIAWAPTAARRVLRCYHALMMLAMAWMYAVLNGHILPGQSGEGQPAEAPTMSMPGMDMGPTATDVTASSGPPGWITAVNWFWFVGFVVAAAVWTYLVVAQRRKPATNRRRRLLYGAGQAMMAAGMAIMFASMVFQV
ncbi:MAG: hypothetical protein QOH91_1125 [Mycobacterium sp.]|jgi:hypothetical protein|nr:hypothetical protein [Mycobacterium sp.]